MWQRCSKNLRRSDVLCAVGVLYNQPIWGGLAHFDSRTWGPPAIFASWGGTSGSSGPRSTGSGALRASREVPSRSGVRKRIMKVYRVPMQRILALLIMMHLVFVACQNTQRRRESANFRDVHQRNISISGGTALPDVISRENVLLTPEPGHMGASWRITNRLPESIFIRAIRITSEGIANQTHGLPTNDGPVAGCDHLDDSEVLPSSPRFISLHFRSTDRRLSVGSYRVEARYQYRSEQRTVVASFQINPLSEVEQSTIVSVAEGALHLHCVSTLARLSTLLAHFGSPELLRRVLEVPGGDFEDWYTLFRGVLTRGRYSSVVLDGTRTGSEMQNVAALSALVEANFPSEDSSMAADRLTEMFSRNELTSLRSLEIFAHHASNRPELTNIVIRRLTSETDHERSSVMFSILGCVQTVPRSARLANILAQATDRIPAQYRSTAGCVSAALISPRVRRLRTVSALCGLDCNFPDEGSYYDRPACEETEFRAVETRVTELPFSLVVLYGATQQTSRGRHAHCYRL